MFFTTTSAILPQNNLKSTRLSHALASLSKTHFNKKSVSDPVCYLTPKPENVNYIIHATKSG